MPELPTRPVAGIPEPARNGSGDQTEEKGAELVPRRKPPRLLLGAGTGLSSYRADFDELRDSRGASPSPCGRSGKSLAPARAKSSFIETGVERTRTENRFPGGPSIVATQRCLGSQWRR